MKSCHVPHAEQNTIMSLDRARTVVFRVFVGGKKVAKKTAVNFKFELFSVLARCWFVRCCRSIHECRTYCQRASSRRRNCTVFFLIQSPKRSDFFSAFVAAHEFCIDWLARFCSLYTPQRMREMRILWSMIPASVSLSVTRLCRRNTAERIEFLLGLETLGDGLKAHCIGRKSRSPRRGEGDSMRPSRNYFGLFFTMWQDGVFCESCNSSSEAVAASPLYSSDFIPPLNLRSLILLVIMDTNTAGLVSIVQCNTLVVRCSRSAYRSSRLHFCHTGSLTLCLA